MPLFGESTSQKTIRDLQAELVRVQAIADQAQQSLRELRDAEELRLRQLADAEEIRLRELRDAKTAQIAQEARDTEALQRIKSANAEWDRVQSQKRDERDRELRRHPPGFNSL